MTTDRQQGANAGINPGYAAFQVAKALTTCEAHPDRAVRERAKERISKWEAVLTSVLDGSIAHGSRAPLRSMPAWVTPEVITGGFATGECLAGGPFQEHEVSLLHRLSMSPEAGDPDRRKLNAHFLTDQGMSELRDRLSSGRYELSVPEEGALMVVAWLLDHGHSEEARNLVDELLPYFDRLRFYPVPSDRQRRSGSSVHLQDAGKTLADVNGIRPNKRILAQKEAVNVWAPLHDRVVGLFLETVEDGCACRKYPDGWEARARALLREHAALLARCSANGKYHRERGHHAQLRGLLERAATQADSLCAWETRRVQSILNSYIAKRGAPGSAQCEDARRRQIESVSGPTFHELASVVAGRLSGCAANDALDDIAHLVQPVTQDEASSRGLPAGTPIPDSIRRKVERCLNAPIGLLVDRGLITSGEALARVLPQVTAGIRAAGIADARLRELVGAIYQAFRRRRSVLLFNLETQVKLGELPWIAALDRFRCESASTQALSRQALEEIASLTMVSFPHVIVPNKLLREFRSLAQSAGLKLPFVDEVAADIFMGRFSGTFVDATRMAAAHLAGSLYARYYDVDYSEMVRESENERFEDTVRPRIAAPAGSGFAEYCAGRAGVALGGWHPAVNGMIIEQQQILTTQNLATLFFGIGLAGSLKHDLAEMAKRCFRWICKRQQAKTGQWHGRLIMVKNTAYAWRQMVFYLGLLSTQDVAGFVQWAERHLAKQPENFRVRFRPVLDGLVQVTNGQPLGSGAVDAAIGRRFLGWSDATHWLLADTSQ
ncbi:hypothetical protein [Burkholderia ubonensis]|uniref:hypothetical protein n=1 Tax=Burkholderia ubonensis TaxID=101571 RepID=UPI0007533CDE|nr:hypothetical protein [Burkholderia ubonensis]AOI68378.1 hypothetical protein WI31_02075 [Burkholderia ubonensis]KUZ14839.1 hypothetical protein WI29_21870 [Burkholderia ubonensis]KUZ21622.1 hypothetical protein WI30_32720 [Burkholderia ubonensis]KUZ24491.1 hypothetical protein WI32_34245 [Burkholderia ubonensis]KUZ53188.1 hypothetical protein WI34_26315 [Burkholderia ubonensis]